MTVKLSCLLFAGIMAVLANSGQSANYIRGCYYTNWGQYRDGKGKFLPENYVSGLCTHIFYAFAIMTPDYTIKATEWNDESTSTSKGMYERVNDLKKQQQGLKTLLSFGGGKFSGENANLMSKMLGSADNRKKFTQSAISFVRKNNFDGFDLDYEYPSAADKSNFATLVKEMKSAFDQESTSSGKPRLLLTAAVAAGYQNIDDGYDVPSLASSLDFINIMTYDFHGEWEKRTGMNSPLYDQNGGRFSVSSAANYWAQKGAPKQKIIIGMSTYGRGWTLSSTNTQVGGPASGPSPAQPFTKEAGVGSYYEMCALLTNGANRLWDDTQKVPYLVKGNLWFGYDDAQSFKEKLNWLKSNGFGGAFTWTLDFDDFSGQCASSNGQKFPLHRLIADTLSSALVWNQESNLFWAKGCDWTGNDLSFAPSSSEGCGPKCASTPRCTHFTWTGYNGGTCWMKQNGVSPGQAKALDEPSMCGYMKAGALTG